ncbi:MAG: hypothetical protein WA975_14185 [Mesorhizobium sp.]|nr:hypothetical protein [Mesorhizobium sp.]
MAFSFRTRNPARDSETDAARFGRLATMLDELLEELEAESAGLLARYQRVADNAAFSLEEFENEQTEALSERADEMTASLMACTQRLLSLQQQATFLRRLRREVAAFRP